MRRKVIQHFANMFPQRFLDLPDGFDLAILAKERSGVVVFNVLQGTASINNVPCSALRTAASYRAWLLKEAEAHGVPTNDLSYASKNGVRVTYDGTERRTVPE